MTPEASLALPHWAKPHGLFVGENPASRINRPGRRKAGTVGEC
jgi:hypothetical protein